MTYAYNPISGTLDRIGDGGGGGGTYNLAGNDDQNLTGTNWSVVTENATVEFIADANDLVLDFGSTNLLLGSDGQNITSATGNTGIGLNALDSLSSGINNIAIGTNALQSATVSGGNIAIGTNALQNRVATGANTIALGSGAFGSLTSGDGIAIGVNTAANITSGVNNIFIGTGIASNYNGAESSNLLIGLGLPTVNGESNVLRLGNNGSSNGQQNRAFIAGTTSAAAAASSVLGVDSNAQVGSLGFGNTGQVLTSNGNLASPTWETASGGSVDINGDTGTISGSNLTISADNAANQSGATVLFDNSGTTSTLKLSDSLLNTFIGFNVGNLSVTGGENIGVGTNCLSSITGGSLNTYVGARCGRFLENGASNSAFGIVALDANVNGSANCAFGQQSLAGTQGSANAAYGYQSHQGAGTGSNNSSFGYAAGNNITDGTQNAYLGYTAGLATTVGNFNCGIGAGALSNITNGQYNTAIGTNAGSANTGSDSSNIYIANVGVTGESDTIRIGSTQTNCYLPGNVETQSKFTAPFDSGAGEGYYFAGGVSALRNGNSSNTNFFFGSSGNSTLSSSFNTGGGFGSLSTITSGTVNTCFGALSGQTLQDAQGCVSLGSNAMQTNASASFVTAIGHRALQTTTATNCALGYAALTNCTTGAANFSAGTTTGQAITDGIFNTIVGEGACPASNSSYGIFIGASSGNQYTTTESSNILIGSGGVTGDNNTIRIGTQGSVPSGQDSCYIAGITGATVTGATVLCDTDGKLGTVVSSKRYKKDIRDLDDNDSILSLNPVHFHYKSNDQASFGLIAEDVHQKFPHLCLYKDGQPESVKYQEMSALLLKEIQRLEARISILEKK